MWIISADLPDGPMGLCLTNSYFKHWATKGEIAINIHICLYAPTSNTQRHRNGVVWRACRDGFRLWILQISVRSPRRISSLWHIRTDILVQKIFTRVNITVVQESRNNTKHRDAKNVKTIKSYNNLALKTVWMYAAVDLSCLRLHSQAAALSVSWRAHGAAEWCAQSRYCLQRNPNLPAAWGRGAFRSGWPVIPLTSVKWQYAILLQ